MRRLLALFGAAALILLSPLPSLASLAGTYLVGPGQDIPTLRAALDSLALDGLHGDVNFKITSGVQVGPFVFGSYSGSGNYKITVSPFEQSVVILLTPDTTQPILRFANAQSIRVERLRVTSPAVSQPAVQILDSSANVGLFDCMLYGRGSGRIVEIIGPQTEHVLLENCSIIRGGTGVYLNGESASAAGNILRNCTIDSVQQGVFASRQTDCRIVGCVIRANFGGSGSATAVNIGTQAATDSVIVDGNSLSELRTPSGYAIAIRHNPVSVTASLRACNNFIYGFQNTGSSQVRAIYVSGGQNRIVNNSILVNDVTATGTAYAVYNALISPDAGLTLLNNIIVNLEATRTAYGLFNLASAAPLVSNHNLFYGTGTGYQLGWYLQAYQSLSAWKTATGFDTFSKSGDPQFESESDLHIRETSELPHQNGSVVYDVQVDKDRDKRFQPPDIGADEYEFLAPPHDAAILNVLGISENSPEYSLLRLEVVVQNRGSADLINIPLRLSYDDTARAEVRISLQPSYADTFLLLWSTGAEHTSSDLVIEVVLGTDANPSDNARAFNHAVTGHPISGIFQIGAGGDFATLSEATLELSRRGISGPVTLELSSGMYNESLLLESIAGLGPNSRLLVRPSPNTEGVVAIAPASGAAVAHLSNVSYVTLEDVILQGNGSLLEVVRLSDNAHHNEIRNCRVLCGSVLQTTASAVHVSAGCSHNRFVDLDISTAYRGMRFEGSSVTSDSSNLVRACRISDVRSGIYATWQNNLIIEDCDIAAGYTDAQTACYGIRIGNLRATDTVRVVQNRLMNGHADADIFGLSCESGSGIVFAANNWIGGFDPATSGPVTALSVTSGRALLYFNSISLGNLSSAQITGVSINGAQTSVGLINNVIRISEPDATARFIELANGTIESNNNLFDAPGSNTQFRFAHSSLDGDFPSLSAWTEATGQDSASVAAPSGFISGSDLHIRPDAFGPSNRGRYLADIAHDADGEARDSVPDIGADEYVFLPAITDLAVESIEIPGIPMMSGSQYYVFALIKNVGQNPVNSASVTLLYNGVGVNTQSVSMTPGELIELNWPWLAPVTNLAYGTLRVEVTTESDAVSENNSLSRSIVVAGPPLAGSVSVGSSESDFIFLSEMAEHLKWRGVSSTLEVLLTENLFSEPLVLDQIPGTDSLRRVIIRPQAENQTMITASNSGAVVTLHNSDYIELRDLNLVAGANTQTGVLLDAQSCHNTITGCTVTGTSSGSLNSTGIRVAGAECHGNQVLYCTVSSFYVGIALTGTVELHSRDNLVSANDIEDTYFGVWVDRQESAVVTRNHIRPGSATGPAGACYGVYILQLGENGSARVDGNMIHGFLDSSGPSTNRATGIYSAPGILSSVEIVNNFIYGYSQLTTLRVRGIYLSSGSHLVANNSIRLDNTPANNETAGIFVSTGTQHEIYNNCVMSYESHVPSFGLDVETGATVVSDYNCFWGNSPNFSFAALGAQTYPSLPSWQAAGQDSNSYNLHALYVSSTDLHVRITDSTLYASGVALPEVLFDIDGDARAETPCIGADEYIYQSVLDAPVGLSIFTLDGTVATLNWQTVPGATGYRIYGALTASDLESSPTELGFTSETAWDWDLAANPVGMRFFHVRAE